MSESPLTSFQRAKAPAIARRGRSPHRRPLPHAHLESRGRRTLRRHHHFRPAAHPRLLARPHPDRPLLLPPPRHRRAREPELRRRVDCAHPRIASATRRRGARRPGAARGRSCSCAASLRRVTASPSRLTARAVPREWRRLAPPGWPAPLVSPILPFHLEADRFWTTKSWDKAQIPKPFEHRGGRAWAANRRVRTGRGDAGARPYRNRARARESRGARPQGAGDRGLSLLRSAPNRHRGGEQADAE